MLAAPATTPFTHAIRTASPEAMDGVVVQPMVRGGVEVMAGVTQDPLFGPLVAYELIMLCASWVPGALGLFLRSKLYPLVLGAVGRNVLPACRSPSPNRSASATMW